MKEIVEFESHQQYLKNVTNAAEVHQVNQKLFIDSLTGSLVKTNSEFQVHQQDQKQQFSALKNETIAQKLTQKAEFDALLKQMTENMASFQVRQE